MLQKDYERNENYETSIFGSMESLSSAIYTWHKKYSSVKPILVPIGQIGREVHFKSFFIFFIAFLLLSTGAGISVASIWSIVHKIEYRFIFSYYLNVGYYSLAAGLLCIPCFLVALGMHYNENNNAFLPLLIGLLIISIGLLVFGTLVGLKFKEPLTFQKPNKILLNNSLKEEIRENMLTSLVQASRNSSDHIRAWDTIQKRLGCCGVFNAEDWINVSLPDSCCLKIPCSSVNTFGKGCIDKLMYNVYWDVSFFIGLNCVLFSIEVACMFYLIISFFIK